MRLRIAIVGTGIAGNVVARRLHAQHDITVFESAPRIGGHSHTRTVSRGDGQWEVDTGFIVYNDRTYPEFIRLLDELGVSSQPAPMSFGVHCERSGWEYSGTSLNGLFAQRRNLLRPTYLGMLADILRFNADARRRVAQPGDTEALGDFLSEHRYGRAFVERYLLPMAGAIWSSEPSRILQFPARALLSFFANHGLLDVTDRPQWRVIRGGSRRYVEALVAPFRDRIRVDCAVTGIRRYADHVQVLSRGSGAERYDAVVLACHSDQALALLTDPSPAERQVLGAIRYQRNDVLLHTDIRVLPHQRRAWAAWNYFAARAPGGAVTVTYDMNVLQGLHAPVRFLVSLNQRGRVDPDLVLEELGYDHPVYDEIALRAQARRSEVSGHARTFYCGAYWGSGFHEDGVRSAQATVAEIESWKRHAQLSVRRAG